MHIAVPTFFSGRKQDFKKFCRQVGIFITTNERDFPNDKSMILFVLSYMTIRPAELWANVFVDKALEAKNWGKWTNFLDGLARDFGDPEESRKVLEEIGQLYQGKGTAMEYFLKLEQLAMTAGATVDKSSHILLQVKKGVNLVLIDQLYQTNEVPRYYTDYKRRIIAMDEMCWRREARKRIVASPLTGKTLKQHPDDMEVDSSRKRKFNDWKCFHCSKNGHLVWSCLKKEDVWAVQGF
jgi:hypothetical protein